MSYRGKVSRALARLRFAREALILQKDSGVRGVEKDQEHSRNRGRFGEEGFDRGGDYRGRLFAGVAVGARRDGREGDGTEAAFGREDQGVTVARGEESGVGFGIAAADRADGVDYMFGSEISGGGDDGFAGRQAPRKNGGAKFAALFKDARAAAAVDGAVNAPSAE